MVKTINTSPMIAAAQMLVQRELTNLEPKEQERTIAAVTELLAQFVRVERDRAVRICRRRAETWRNTSAATSTIGSAREEARARGNEANYLADLLESGEDLSEFVM
jgi:hypothetical protein